MGPGIDAAFLNKAPPAIFFISSRLILRSFGKSLILILDIFLIIYKKYFANRGVPKMINTKDCNIELPICRSLEMLKYQTIKNQFHSSFSLSNGWKKIAPKATDSQMRITKTYSYITIMSQNLLKFA